MAFSHVIVQQPVLQRHTEAHGIDQCQLCPYNCIALSHMVQQPCSVTEAHAIYQYQLCPYNRTALTSDSGMCKSKMAKIFILYTFA